MGVFLKKNSNNILISFLVFLLSASGLIFLALTPLISNYYDSDNWYRIFFHGITKWRIAGFTTSYEASGFPLHFTILSVIGISLAVLGSIYWLLHTLSGKRKCSLTNSELPGPITGFLLGLGGLISFISSMVFIPYGNNATGGGNTYAYGYIVTAVIFGLLLIIGAMIIFSPKKAKKSSKKKKG